jgi:hypothetical protein
MESREGFASFRRRKQTCFYAEKINPVKLIVFAGIQIIFKDRKALRVV